ncbi:uncharacterized protein LOC133797388 isoform X2 [Humulus lupulus]|uniref:uncharacterized protein LOC133797388 isoform X2 n=1 Tax=Humulus lupulus TaxID=3486 RepID=UPI002B40C691|nr:uncharacterized protein LOC133797388 isoform X2 [Humulus lupulus]
MLEFEPCELAGISAKWSNKDEWWFLSRSFYRNSTSQDRHRKTKTGNWKITGEGKKIEDSIGEKSYLTFYIGSGKSAQKTEYTMQEYYIPQHDHHHQEYILVICCMRLRKQTKKKKAPTRVTSRSKKTGRKAYAPRHEEGEPSGNNITSDLENSVPSAVTSLKFNRDCRLERKTDAKRPRTTSPDSDTGQLSGQSTTGDELQVLFSAISELHGNNQDNPEQLFLQQNSQNSHLKSVNEVQGSFGGDKVDDDDDDIDFANSLIVDPDENGVGVLRERHQRGRKKTRLSGGSSYLWFSLFQIWLARRQGRPVAPPISSRDFR